MGSGHISDRGLQRDQLSCLVNADSLTPMIAFLAEVPRHELRIDRVTEEEMHSFITCLRPAQPGSETNTPFHGRGNWGM